MNSRRRLAKTVEDIEDAIAMLRFASADLPTTTERHLFLQAVGMLEIATARVAGLLEPVDVDAS